MPNSKAVMNPSYPQKNRVDMPVPQSTTILVIGGGPGGSYAATVLARENVNVVVIEADKFPRYHIGESHLASLRHFLRFIELEEQFDNYGFQKKAGAGFKLNQYKREGYTDFVSQDPNNYSWNTVRSESDELMLRHAERQGAKVFEETKITEIEFDGKPGDHDARPKAALWKSKQGETGKITFEYVIDASGRAGIISTKYLKNRLFNEDLKNVAIWGYWKDGGKYLPGTYRENSPLFEALLDESGWTWYIPLHDGVVSIGIVMNQAKSNAKKAADKEAGLDTALLAFYQRELKRTPKIIELLGKGTLTQKEGLPLVNSASDYSYHASHYAGPGFRLVGDAGAFIDPYFSSGVHLAISGGLNAAASILAVHKGEVTEELSSEWYTKRTEAAYTRFLLVVLSAYQQIRAQSKPILSEINEDNFDRAFDFFRPIIQGSQDANRGVPGDMSKTIEFLAEHAFEPSEPEERATILEKYKGTTKDTTGLSDAETAREKAIYQGIMIRKLLRTEDIVNLDNFVTDTICGLRIKMKRGAVGLEKVA